jgi:8-oxo-dGTP diphosphatase
MPPDSRVVVGAAAVVAHEGHLLMIQRGGDGEWSSNGAGTWALPGGWIELDDADVESTAVREVREETGVWVEPHAAAGHTFGRWPDKEKAIVTVFVVCQYVHGEPQVREPDKCPAVEWVPLAEVADRPLFEPLAMWWPVNGRYLMAS